MSESREYVNDDGNRYTVETSKSGDVRICHYTHYGSLLRSIDVPEEVLELAQPEASSADTLAVDLSGVRMQVETASSAGNADESPYLHGFANGLICALATVEGTEPEFLKQPTDGYLADRRLMLEQEAAAAKVAKDEKPEARTPAPRGRRAAAAAKA